MRVGIDWMPNEPANSNCASVSTLPNTMPGCCSDAASKMGPNMRQGPHHEAQKSTSIVAFDPATSPKFSFVSSTVDLGGDIHIQESAMGVGPQALVVPLTVGDGRLGVRLGRSLTLPVPGLPRTGLDQPDAGGGKEHGTQNPSQRGGADPHILETRCQYDEGDHRPDVAVRGPRGQERPDHHGGDATDDQGSGHR